MKWFPKTRQSWRRWKWRHDYIRTVEVFRPDMPRAVIVDRSLKHLIFFGEETNAVDIASKYGIWH